MMIDVPIYLVYAALLSPVGVIFTLPFIILSIVGFFGPVFVNGYKLLFNAIFRRDPSVAKDLEFVRVLFSFIFLVHSYIWHSYEVINFDNIPDSGPALIVYYHGAIPIDYYYLFSKCYLQKRQTLRTIGDRFLFKIPGLHLWMKVSLAFPGTIEHCVEMLKSGHLVSIAPGGVREALFSHNYNLIWNNRIGFAKIAIAAQVPIIPVFTVNIREAYRTVSFGEKLFRKLYEITRLPVVPIYGGFPVKLKTVIGKPIEFDPNITAEHLALKTEKAIENLIKDNQKIPGNILKATIERVPQFIKHKMI